MSSLSLSDVLDVDYPGRPAWSADSRFIAVPLYQNNGQTLLVVDTTREMGEHTCRLPEDDSHVVAFAWAPTAESSELVLMTDANETLLFDAADGSIRRLSKTAGGETAPTWSNDGSQIAYYHDGRPCVREIESNTIRVFDVPTNDRFLSESRMFAWRDDDARLAFRFTDRGTKQIGVVNPDTGELRWRTSGTSADHSPTWINGRVVIDQTSERGTIRRILAIDPESGDQTVLYEEIDRELGVVSQGAPTVSSDGRRLALALSHDGWNHVHVLDTATDERTQLTTGPFDDTGLADSVPQWVDEMTLLFASNRRDSGQRQLFTVTLDGKEPIPVVESSGTNVHPIPAPDGERVAYIHADRKRSPECRISHLRSDGAVHRLTKSVVDSWPIDPIEPNHVTFESVDGTEIHAYLLDPRGSENGNRIDEDATGLPAVVWVHGGPMRQMRDGWHPSRSYGLAYTFQQYLANRGYVCLLVNYRGGIGYGTAFRQALATGYGRDEMADIVAGAEYLTKRPYVASDAVGVWGLSYGGYATLQLLGTYPETFAVGINIAGLANIQTYREWAGETKYSPAESTEEVLLGGNPWETSTAWADASPISHMEHYEAPVYNFHGMNDHYVNVEQQHIVVDRLLELDKPFEAEYYPNENHVFAKRTTWERTLSKIVTAFDEHLWDEPPDT